MLAAKIDELGTTTANNHFAVGWAHALDTPYKWTKQVGSHWGGTRNGTVIHWPAGIEAKGEIRHQFSHVIDIAATVLDAAGLPEPTFVHGVQQMPLHGKSMLPSFADPEAPEHRETQYFEMFVNRGVYHKGWTAATRHSVPWVVGAELPAIDDDVWELYAPDDWPSPTTLPPSSPRSCASCSGCS
jgi:arylsulfatase